MPSFSFTLTTANTTSPTATSSNLVPFALNYRNGMPTTVALSFGGSSTVSNDCTVQYTFDDIMRVTSTGVTWSILSSAAPAFGANSTTAYHLASTTWFDVGYAVSFSGPVAAVRLGCTSIGSTGGLGSVTLKVLQGESW